MHFLHIQQYQDLFLRMVARLSIGLHAVSITTNFRILDSLLWFPIDPVRARIWAISSHREDLLEMENIDGIILKLTDYM
ncbi:hypothetical protein NQ317_013839 [Molorchus minor]|uniref:Uncharacterized protein n=1 Tax=Molorchus minor TaxID=1323400 RepID=A0ABQ9J3Q5_9CUCU|nr:hypothetical protein NQ317_013839 [Molorchus minor]